MPPKPSSSPQKSSDIAKVHNKYNSNFFMMRDTAWQRFAFRRPLEIGELSGSKTLKVANPYAHNST
jgi:hypothetical protein